MEFIEWDTLAALFFTWSRLVKSLAGCGVLVADGKKLIPTVAKSFLLAILTVAQGYAVQEPLASGPATRAKSGSLNCRSCATIIHHEHGCTRSGGQTCNQQNRQEFSEL